MDEWRTRSTAVLNTIPQAVLFIDSLGKRSLINATAAALMGIEKAEHTPDVIAEAMTRLRKRASNADEILESALQLFGSPDQSIHDWVWIFKGHNPGVYKVSCVPMSSLNVKGRLWVFDDVTAEHRAAEILKVSNAELTDQRSEADRRNHNKSDFLAHMSHEIRTPMNGILGLVQLLENEPLPPETLGMVHRLKATGQSLRGIIDDILDMSKIEAGQMCIEIQAFSLTELLNHLQELMGSRAGTKGLDLIIDNLSGVTDPLLGDALRLEQILSNLLGNAIKFTEKGAVTLHISRMLTDTDGIRLRFEVRDEGIGMSAEQVGRIFKSYQQAETSTTRRFGGTGLGLVISKQLVELMGGVIGLESLEGCGSTFWFVLSFDKADAQQALSPDKPVRAQESLEGLHILIVDDVSLNRFMLEKSLSKSGAIIEQAADGAEAVEKIRSSVTGFNIVLMDVQMPGVDGLGATRIIRKELGNSQLPIIALTAGVMAKEKQAVIDAGMTDFVAKPIDLANLNKLIRQYCF